MAEDPHDLLSSWRWRALRRVLPRRYREGWSTELLQAHVNRRTARGIGAMRFWLLLVIDVVLTGARVRVDRWIDAAASLRRVHLMDTLRHNLLLAARGLARTPGFTIAVVLTLALGLGANATLFTVIDRLLLSPPEHVVQPEQVRRIVVRAPSHIGDEMGFQAALTYPDYRELRAIDAFSSVAAYNLQSLTLGQGIESERIDVEFATASYFPLLGVKPAAGRFYTEAEDRIAGAEPTVVLGWGFWQRRFGGSRSVIGTRLAIGKGSYTVIGVAPRAFTGVNFGPVDVWLPMHTAQAIQSGTEWEDARGWYWLTALARLKPGASEIGAFAEATTHYRAGRAEAGSRYATAEVLGTSIIEARGPDPSRESRVAQALGAIALLVLLIACANVANLFLARGVQRRRMLAVQSALGVGRGRLFLQLLTEAVLLSLAAGAFAFAIAEAIGPALFRTLFPETAPPPTNGLRVLLFTTILAGTTIMLAGLVPAHRASRVDPAEVLRSSRMSPRSSWLRLGLLAAQASFSVVLLISAGLFLRSLQQANRLDLGVDLDAIALDIELTDGTRSGEELAAVAYPLLEQVRRHPAVASATITNLPPFGGLWGISFRLPAPDTLPRGSIPAFYSGDEDYFRTLGLDLRLGRVFTRAETSDPAAPVVVVNAAFARRFWHSEQASIGKCLLFGSDPSSTSCTTVIGVVEDMLPSLTATEPRLAYYLPTRHAGISFDAGQVIIFRLRDGMQDQLHAVRNFARTAVPGIRYIDAAPLRNRIAQQLRAWQMGATLLTVFGLLALIVAAAGLYSSLAFDVAQRRFELGVRAALGAPAHGLIRALAGGVLPALATGMFAGLAGALALARLSTDLLFKVSPFEPAIYLGALVLLSLVAVSAAVLPARRAIRTDPRVALAAD